MKRKKVATSLLGAVCAVTVLAWIVITLLAGPKQAALAEANTSSHDPLRSSLNHHSKNSVALGPAHARVGTFLVSLSDLNPQDKTFNAEFWLWSNTPSKDVRPLQTVEFTNAEDASTSLDYTEDVTSTTDIDNTFYESLKVKGTFRHDWDARNYPFDRHTLQVQIEDANSDANSLIYDSDTVNSGYDSELDLPDWRITDFQLATHDYVYKTNFGLPNLATDSPSTYSRLTISISVVRSDITNFLKLIGPVYLAIVVTLICFLLYDDTSSQLALLAAMLFAVIINLQNVSGTVGIQKGVTLMDKIHIVALLYIVGVTLIAIYSNVLLEKNSDKNRVKRFNYICLALSGISFVAINALLIVQAISIG